MWPQKFFPECLSDQHEANNRQEDTEQGTQQGGEDKGEDRGALEKGGKVVHVCSVART